VRFAVIVCVEIVNAHLRCPSCKVVERPMHGRSLLV
jgi:hypothetical protein